LCFRLTVIILFVLCDGTSICLVFFFFKQKTAYEM